MDAENGKTDGGTLQVPSEPTARGFPALRRFSFKITAVLLCRAAIFVILIIGFAGSFWLSRKQREWIVNDRRASVDAAADALADDLRDEWNLLETRLFELRAAILTNREMDLRSFQTFAADALSQRNLNYPIAGAGYIARVGAADAVLYLSRIRLLGQPNFNIIPAGGPGEKFIVQYTFPAEYPFLAPGRDAAFDDDWKDALATAREGNITTSICSILAGGEKYISMIRPAGDGWVFATVRLYAPLQAAAAKISKQEFYKKVIPCLTPESRRESVWARIDDGRVTVARKLQIGDQPWELLVANAEDTVGILSGYIPFIILTLGCLATAGAAIAAIFVLRRFENLKQQITTAEAAQRSSAIQRRALGLMAAAMDDGAIITDASGAAIWINDAFTNVTGFAKADYLSKNPTSLILTKGAEPEQVREMKQRLAAGERVRVEIQLSVGGRSRLVECEVHPIRDEEDNITNFLVVFRDISDQRQAAVEIARARDEAILNSERRAQFTENLTRELRTHLTGVIGMSKVLLDTTLTTEQRELGRTVRNCGETLGKILEDITDLSRIESGSLTLDALEFDPRELLEDLVELFAEEAAVRGLELVCWVDPAIPATVTGDPARVRQVIVNLLDNAVNFTNVGEVAVKLDLAPNFTIQNPRLIFTVGDTGIGISPEDCKQLFQPFVRGANATARRSRGPGLGLAVSKQIALRMGGEINVKSELSKGSEFIFSVPFGSAVAAGEMIQKEIAGKRILMVEDHPLSREAVCAWLRAWGADVTESDSGAHALGMFMDPASRQAPFDAIVIDEQMPIIDGLTVVNAMRQEPANAATPVVFMSSFSRNITKETHAVLGVHTILPKPVRCARLFDAVKLAVGGKLVIEAPSDPSKETVKSENAKDIGASAARRPRALVVEDDNVCQKVARALLKKLGWDSEVASNGREALELCFRDEFNIILMDCQMPDMDGFEATSAIRAAEGAQRRSPIIAMTANVGQGEKEHCISAGMDDYLSKPVKLEELKQKLEQWASRPSADAIIPAEPPPSVSSQISPADFQRLSTTILLRLKSVGLLDQPTACEGTVRSFVKGAGDIVVSVRGACSEQDMDGTAQLAQRLQRASAHFGAEKLSDLASKLLAKIQGDDTTGALELVNEVENELALVREVALELVKNPESLRSFQAAAGIL